jgi:hypothetical protein
MLFLLPGKGSINDQRMVKDKGNAHLPAQLSGWEDFCLDGEVVVASQEVRQLLGC